MHTFRILFTTLDIEKNMFMSEGSVYHTYKRELKMVIFRNTTIYTTPCPLTLPLLTSPLPLRMLRHAPLDVVLLADEIHTPMLETCFAADSRVSVAFLCDMRTWIKLMFLVRLKEQPITANVPGLGLGGLGEINRIDVAHNSNERFSCTV